MNKFTSLATGMLLVATGFNTMAQRAFKVIGYVPNWKDPSGIAATIPYEKITHINYAFVQPDASGNIIETAGLASIVQAAHAKNVKVLASLGGATASEQNTALFKDLFSAGKADGFAKKIMAFVEQYNLDGFDLDIEGPAVDASLGTIVAKLAPLLKAKGKLLTCALSQGYGGTKAPDAALRQMDWINVMAYDLTGPWAAGSPGPHSPFDWSTQQLNYFKGRVGGDASKVVLGVPFYGHGFGSEAGSFDYKVILAKYPNAHSTDQVGNTIYYNGIPTIRSKTQWAMRNAAGIMIWELTQDAVGQYSLLGTINKEVGPSGIHSNDNASDAVELFPNPATSSFSLVGLPFSQKIDVLVYDVMGKQVAAFNAYEEQFRIDGLASGLYIVSVLLDGNEYAKLKVVKQ